MGCLHVGLKHLIIRISTGLYLILEEPHGMDPKIVGDLDVIADPLDRILDLDTIQVRLKLQYVRRPSK